MSQRWSTSGKLAHARLLYRDEGPLEDEKRATGDVVASGIDLVEEWEIYTARAKEVIVE